jgi:hypothetical protein
VVKSSFLGGGGTTTTVGGELILSANLNAYATTRVSPTIYSTTNTGGAYPFLGAGNLVISPRISGASRDVIFATGATPTATLIVTGTNRVLIGTTTDDGANLLQVAPDTDVVGIIGRARIGYGGVTADRTHFTHIDKALNGLWVDQNAQVALSMGTSQNLLFRVESATFATLAGPTAAATSAACTFASTSTITGGVTDAYTTSLRFTPTYSAATALTVARHNYIDFNNPALSGVGPAALTDACIFRYDAAVGTHKALDAATTKTTPGGVDGWEKRNVNGTIMYSPLYLSKTA